MEQYTKEQIADFCKRFGLEDHELPLEMAISGQPKNILAFITYLSTELHTTRMSIISAAKKDALLKEGQICQMREGETFIYHNGGWMWYDDYCKQQDKPID